MLDQEIPGKGFAGQIVKHRKEKENESYGQTRSHQGHDQRFTIKLSDEVSSARSDGFTDAHFLCPVRGPGGGEVYEIDTRDEQDKQCQSGKKVNIQNGPTRAVERIEVHSRDRLKGHRTFVLGTVPFDNIFNFCIDRLHRCVFVQLNIGSDVVNIPCIEIFVMSHGQCGWEYVLETHVRVGWIVLEYTRDFHVQSCVKG